MERRREGVVGLVQYKMLQQRATAIQDQTQQQIEKIKFDYLVKEAEVKDNDYLKVKFTFRACEKNEIFCFCQFSFFLVLHTLRFYHIVPWP